MKPYAVALASATVLAVLLMASLGILLVRGESGIDAQGAVVTDGTGPSFAVRALSLEPEIVVTSSGPIPSRCSVTVCNVDGMDVQVLGLPQGSTLVREAGSVTASLAVSGEARIVLRPGTNGGQLAPVNGSSLFYVVGDTHGRGEVVDRMLADAAADEPLFILHTGDMTPAGDAGQLIALADRFSDAGIPFFATAGNHDAKGDTAVLDLYAPPFASFRHDGYSFILARSSPEGIDGDVMSSLAFSLAEASARNDTAVVATHVPPFKPCGIDHTYLDGDVSGELASTLASGGADALLCGHLHLFNRTGLDGVDCIVSGGGGGTLYAAEAEGGFHHYLRVEMGAAGLDAAPVRVDISGYGASSITVIGHAGRTVIDMTAPPESLATVTGFSSFENQYGNVKGEGEYSGWLLADLLALVGGVETGDTVEVTAADGYKVKLCYWNVHPNATWLQAQGDFILAFSFDGEASPAWSDSPRLACLPGDGLFSNADAEATTPPGTMVPVSAGAVWVRNVAKIEIV